MVGGPIFTVLGQLSCRSNAGGDIVLQQRAGLGAELWRGSAVGGRWPAYVDESVACTEYAAACGGGGFVRLFSV